MSTQREELARDIFVADNSSIPSAGDEWDTFCAVIDAPLSHYAYGIADGLITKGYRKPRAITTVEELDALPDEIILRSGGVTYEHHDGWFHGVDGSNVVAESISLPAAILWEPEAEVAA